MIESSRNSDKLYLQYPTLYKHETYVSAIDEDARGNFLQFRETIFHPQGGGQPCDLGTANQIPILEVRRERLVEEDIGDFIVKHYIDPNSVQLFSQGDSVILEIDPKKREQYTRVHSTGHLISALVEDEFPYLHCLDGNYNPEHAYVQFTIGSKNKALSKNKIFTFLELKIGDVVKSNLPITIHNSKQTRTIQIGHFTPSDCLGTNVKSLQEIGEVSIKNIRIKQNMVRVNYEVL